MPKVERPRQQLRFSTDHVPNLSAPPTGGSQQLHTAPWTTNQTDRYTRKPNPGTPTTEHADPAPGPPHGDHPTQEHVTIHRVPGARVALIYPLTHHQTPSRRGFHPANPITATMHTHSPHPRTSTPASLTPPGQAVHLQPIRPPYSSAQAGSRGNRGWPGHRHSKTATPQAVPRDAEAQTPPRRA